MPTGHMDRADRYGVGGWAAAPDQPDTPIDVIVSINGQWCAQISADRLREDLQAAGSWGEGKHGFRYLFPTPLPDQVDHRVAVRFAATGDLVPNGERLIPAATGPRLTPVLVTAPGRSGTTLLMSRLAASEQVALVDFYPFEVRMLAYYASLFRVLTAPANLDRSTHPDRLEGDGFFVGANPFASPIYRDAFQVPERFEAFFRAYVPAELMAFVRNAMEAFYLRVREDNNKPQARFFAEKSNNLDEQPRAFAREAFPELKEIVLLRDPRDLYCSHRAYFHSDPATALQEVRFACDQLTQIAGERDVSLHMMRYEDLVTDNGAALHLLAQYLGFDLFPPPRQERDAEIFAEHATSRSPRASIGRWRTDLSAEEQDRLTEAFRPFLGTFGYLIHPLTGAAVG